MKNKLIFTIFIVFYLIFDSNGQERYISSVFDEIVVQTFTYSVKNGINYDLDVYRPELDSERKRPLMIYLHGGGFQSGTRNSPEIVAFCKKMAGYGYVVASISYQLTRKDKESAFGCDCKAVDKLNTFRTAVFDIQDAAFFLVQNRENIGIDPHKIILAGSSAGAEAVLNAAYSPPNCYGLDSGPVSYAGVIGMAGAIPDTIVIYNESAVPSLLFHGTDDNLVPYASAPHHYCNKDKPGYLILHGSATIAYKLAKLNVPYWLHTTCGGGHEIAGTPMKDYFNEITEFCYHFVILKDGKTKHTVIKSKPQDSKYQLFNYCNQ
jgi:predicted esterase